MNKKLPGIIKHFQIKGSPSGISPIGSGHINDSYLITTTPGPAPDYVLQRINHQIFKDIPGLMNNIEIVTSHIRKKLSDENRTGEYRALEIIPTRDGQLYLHDRAGDYWRLYYHIPGSHSYDRVENPRLAYEGGKAFGKFMQLTSDIDPHTLIATIPRFHDIAWRLGQFEEAVQNDPVKRVSEIHPEIEFIHYRTEEMHTVHRLVESGEMPVRITHNDTKFNNILFDKNNTAICIIDLDTVMPGTVLYDFGDAIRTGANITEEDESDLSKVGLQMELLEAYSRGFLEAAGSSLTPVETGCLVLSAKFMTFIIGLRFLTDHVNGDTYFKIHHPGHNLQRARNQFQLLRDMEEKTSQMERILRLIRF